LSISIIGDVGGNMEKQDDHNPRIDSLIEAITCLQQGNYYIDVMVDSNDAIGQIAGSLRSLALSLQNRQNERLKLDNITAQVDAGLILDDILETVYREFREVIPYNRIGFSLIDDDGQTVRARWARSDRPRMELHAGYCAPLKGSSLENIIRTQRPRIINDLAAYLEHKPTSESTHLIVQEGMRASLTCPLLVQGRAVGFMFFSSIDPDTYMNAHVDIFSQIARQMSVTLEKGHLMLELAVQKAEVEQHREELRYLNQVKDVFMGMAAHDLRNPLALVKMILEYELNPEIKLSKADRNNFLRKALGQTNYMLLLLNDLVDANLLQSGQFQLQIKSVQLRDFLTEAVERHDALAQEKKTRVIPEGEIPDVEIQADPSRLRQVIDNLLSNAVKYSPPGSTVRVYADRVPSEITIHVRDEGPGIASEEQPLLFQEFTRLSTEPTGNEKSTGLGLAIVRRIVEAHKGRIGVDTEPGHGADFWFALPASE